MTKLYPTQYEIFMPNITNYKMILNDFLERILNPNKLDFIQISFLFVKQKYSISFMQLRQGFLLFPFGYSLTNDDFFI